MKVHYINILLFALPLNILVNTHKKPSITTLHTPKIPTTRLLCECELYAPANYDNDLEMKSVMENFNKQTQQRFQEYDERLQEKRQKCKEQCDKEIQKIILKDKLEKELMDKFATLETDIQSDAIPTCICEKSIADKVEKGCLRCGTSVGVALPGLGVLGAYGAHSMVKIAMTAAENWGIKLATKEGIKAGIDAVITALNSSLNIDTFGGITLNTVLNGNNFKNVNFLVQLIKNEYIKICRVPDPNSDKFLCLYGSIGGDNVAYQFIETKVGSAVTSGTEAATAKTAKMTTIYTTEELSKVTNAGSILSNPIIVSFIVIVIVVIILLIIYLVLRHRRKKKMKKKLQYIKLLEE
ncbi:rifin [Plasmodium reichenowi]|uniref:Rifin n=1 Tax=Plasmodium reichenowi TaxID=5854 RepID=A0A060RMD1_PLARE|nr:rifin [Plasmodium reichenowi]